MGKQYQVVGRNDEVTTCEHCGKQHLKYTVILKDDEGNYVRYGKDCASRACSFASGKKSAAQIEAAAGAIAYGQKMAGLVKANPGKYTRKQMVDAVWNKYGAVVDLKGDTMVITTGPGEKVGIPLAGLTFR